MGKKQHYVPQVLLRCFSTDVDKKFINIYNLRSKEIILDGILSTQGYERYLYGKDQKLEEEYQKIETNMDAIFNKLSNHESTLSSDDLFRLKLFMNFQTCRTPVMKEKMTEMDDMFISGIAEDDNEVKEILHEESLKGEEPCKRLFKTAIDSSIILYDLKLGLLINKTEIPFVIGQHPVNVLNPFLVERKWQHSINGLASKGAMLFMPVSKDVGIILYDPVRYKLTSFRNIVNVNEQDVNKLNIVQFASTQDCVFYRDNISIDVLNSYNNSTSSYRNGPKTKLEKMKCRIDGKPELHDIIHTSQVNLPIEQRFSFVGITENAFYEDLGYTLDVSRDTVKQYLKRDYSGKYEIKRKR